MHNCLKRLEHRSRSSFPSPYLDEITKFNTFLECRRKRGEKDLVETPQVIIARRLTLERMEELKDDLKRDRDEYK